MNHVIKSVVEARQIKLACEELVLRFAMLNDGRRYDEMVNLFTEDGVFYRPLAPEQGVAGKAAILTDMKRKPEHLQSVHVCTNIVVDVLDETRASALSYFTVYLHDTRTAHPAGGFSGKAYVGEYNDEFRCVDGEWLIACRRGRNYFNLEAPGIA